MVDRAGSERLRANHHMGCRNSGITSQPDVPDQPVAKYCARVLVGSSAIFRNSFPCLSKSLWDSHFLGVLLAALSTM